MVLTSTGIQAPILSHPGGSLGVAVGFPLEDLPEIGVHIMKRRVEGDDSNPLVWWRTERPRSSKIEKILSELLVPLREVEMLPGSLIHAQAAREKIFSASLGSTS
jgi:hypothetical protein